MKVTRIVIEELDGLDVAHIKLDQAISLLTGLKLLRAEYKIQDVEEPMSLGDQQLALERRIRDLKRDKLAYELERLKAEAAHDQTPEERRHVRQAKIAELEAKLNG